MYTPFEERDLPVEITENNTHNIKLNIKYCDAVYHRDKKFEIRKNDRNYQVGDFIKFIPVNENGEAHHPIETKIYQITYILDDFEGLSEGFIAFTIKEDHEDENIYRKVERDYKIADINSEIAQNDDIDSILIEELTYDDDCNCFDKRNTHIMDEIIDAIEDHLSDGYWEEYWNAVGKGISEVEKRHKEIFANKIVSFMKDFDFYDFQDNMEVGESDEDMTEQVMELLTSEEGISSILEYLNKITEEEITSDQKIELGSIINILTNMNM